MSAGRPSTYSPEMAKLICERIATHDCGIQKLVDMYDDMPMKSTIRLWKLKHIEFSSQYADAKRQQVENLAEDIIDICDNSSEDYYIDENGKEQFNSEHVQRARLRVDTRKWMAAKLAPKIYGDRKVEEQQNPQETLSKIQALVADLNKTNVSDI